MQVPIPGYKSNEAPSTEVPLLRERVLQLFESCDKYLAASIPVSQDDVKEALGIAYELQDKKLVAGSLLRLGIIQDQLSESTTAINSLLEARKLYVSLNLPEDAAACNMHIADCCFRLRDFENALDNNLEALRIHKEYDHPAVMANLYNRLGTIYQNTRDWQHASESFGKALEIYNRMGDDKAATMALFSIGNVYNWSDDLGNCSLYLHRGEKKAREIGDDLLILKVVSSIAILYTKLGKFDISLKYFNEGLALAEKLGEVNVKCSMLKSLGNLYNKLGQYDKAISILAESLKIAEELNSVVVLTLIHQFYSDAYEGLGDHKKALHHHKEYYRYDKQIVTEEIRLKAKGQQAKLELEEARKESEIYRLKNIDLAQAYDEIIRQKTEIQQKNKEITDSITYARRIQDAILPREELVSRHLPDSFIFYKPKDIVSGDFYFFTTVKAPASNGNEQKNWLVMAAVDCTGHGVPGAFMSMIGNNILNQIVVDKKVTSPAIALSVLDQKVVQSLKQYEANTELNDGMDIALCAIDPEDLFMQYAGAHRPLVLIRNGEVTEYKASKYAIGGYHRDDKAFLLENIKLQKGDTFYLFTDGFADQFGGPKGKKFKHKKLIALLQSMHDKPMSEQKLMLENVFTEWRGGLEQVDDILVIGIRV